MRNKIIPKQRLSKIFKWSISPKLFNIFKFSGSFYSEYSALLTEIIFKFVDALLQI